MKATYIAISATSFATVRGSSAQGCSVFRHSSCVLPNGSSRRSMPRGAVGFQEFSSLRSFWELAGDSPVHEAWKSSWQASLKNIIGGP